MDRQLQRSTMSAFWERKEPVPEGCYSILLFFHAVAVDAIQYDWLISSSILLIYLPLPDLKRELAGKGYPIGVSLWRRDTLGTFQPFFFKVRQLL